MCSDNLVLKSRKTENFVGLLLFLKIFLHVHNDFFGCLHGAKCVVDR